MKEKKAGREETFWVTQMCDGQRWRTIWEGVGKESSLTFRRVKME